MAAAGGIVALLATGVVTGCGASTEPETGALPSGSASTTAATVTPLGQVRVGDCVSNADLTAGKTSGVATLTVVDCTTSGSAPVLVAEPFTTSFSGPDPAAPAYPGFPSMSFIAVDECDRHKGVDNPDKTMNHAFPDKATWESGDRVIVCVDPDRAEGTYQW